MSLDKKRESEGMENSNSIELTGKGKKRGAWPVGADLTYLD